MSSGGDVECRAGQVARAFFEAATKLSEDNEDILPQEDAPDLKLSVFFLFSELFPEFVCDKDKDAPGKGGLMRLQFNKIGYEIYDKEQSRRVPAVRAKPGNPGYGFRRARWRNSLEGEDKRVCESVLKTLGVSVERIERVKARVNDIRLQWEAVRRPSRPAGPGRPRGHKRPNHDSAATPTGTAAASSSWGGEALTLSGPGDGEGTKKCKKKGTSRASAGPREDASALGKGQAQPAIVMLAKVEDDAKEEVLQEPVLWTTPPESSIETEVDDDDEHRQASCLTEENQSLRSLNMNLIFEREQLMREVAEEEATVDQLQQNVNSLLRDMTTSSVPDATAVSQAFAWLADKLNGKCEGSDLGGGNTMAGVFRETLERILDKFDEWEKHGPRRPPTSLQLRREIVRATHPNDPSLSHHPSPGDESIIRGGVLDESEAGLDALRMADVQDSSSMMRGYDKNCEYLFPHPAF